MSIYSFRPIQELPHDILRYIYDFIQTDWLNLCSKRFWHLYVKNEYRSRLCLWYRLQKQKIQLQRLITKKKQQLCDLRHVRYKNFRDVDMLTHEKENIADDIAWLREDINSIYKRQQGIYGCGVSYKYMDIRFCEIIGR